MDKETLRTKIKAHIAALDIDYIAESELAIAQSIKSLPEFVLAPRVFTYISVGREVDTRKIIEHCLANKKTVALPFCYENGIMRFSILDRPVKDLPCGLYGIPSPPASFEELFPQKGDIIIVPALCYSEEGYRLGRGGGYYDRYLSTFQVFSVGLCREKQLVIEMPTDDFDMRVECLITEKRIARPFRPRK